MKSILPSKLNSTQSHAMPDKKEASCILASKASGKDGEELSLDTMTFNSFVSVSIVYGV